MKKPIATFVAAAGILAAFAETSTNTSPGGVVQEKKYPWNSGVTAGLSITRGNSDSLLATVKLLTAKKTPADELSFGADAAYGSANSVENNQSLHAFGQWNHFFSDRTFGYVRADALHDGISEIKYRATLTAGLGYYFIKNAQTTLAGEVGPGLIVERVGTTDTTFATLRLAERWEHKFTSNNARVFESVEILPQVDRVSDFLINAEIGVEASIARNLSLNVTLDDAFNSEPATSHKRNDLKLVSGVTYKF